MQKKFFAESETETEVAEVINQAGGSQATQEQSKSID
jgi:hypothetical protein